MVECKVLSELEIIQGILAGDKSLYEIIVRRYNPSLYNVGRSYNYNHEDTMDLIQDTYIDAYQHLSQFKGLSTFKTWIIRIMLNNCYNKRLKFSYQREESKDPQENSKPIFMNSDNNGNKIIQNRELGVIIKEAISQIPLKYRMVFSLREIDGLSVAETASTLNISESNVKVRYKRARAMLRKEIEEKYSLHDLFGFNITYCDRITHYVMERIYELPG